MRFNGRTVVITGAGGGIGEQTARRFHAEGANAVLLDVKTAAVAAVAASLPGALALTVDVTSAAAVRDMVAQVTSIFGSIDVLINNAMTCSDEPFLTISPEEARRDIDVNLMGPFLLSQQVIPGMISRGGGVILNVSSVNSLGYFGNEAYSAAKAGLNSLTTSIAAQFGEHGIRCNAVAPGTVATAHWSRRIEDDPEVLNRAARWYPLGRVGEPDDIADALLFLASEQASWISGALLPVEGGLLTGNLAMARGITLQG